VAIDQGFSGSEEEPPVADSPLAGYGFRGVEDEAIGTRVSGLVGVLVTFGVGAAIIGTFVVLRKRNRTSV
jgi:hypothetical protein